MSIPSEDDVYWLEPLILLPEEKDLVIADEKSTLKSENSPVAQSGQKLIAVQPNETHSSSDICCFSSVQYDNSTEAEKILEPLSFTNDLDEVSFSMGSNCQSNDGGWINGVMNILDEAEKVSIEDQDCQASQAMMSLGTDMLSGIESEVMESIAMISLDPTVVPNGDRNNEDANNDDSKNNERLQERQQGEGTTKLPPLCCIHEGPKTNVYRLNDQMNKFGGKTKAVAVKVLSDQFPDENQMAELEIERIMSSRLSVQCSSVRAALSSNNSSTIGLMEDESSSSRTLFLEWVPGVTVREWATRAAAQGGGPQKLNEKVSSSVSSISSKRSRHGTSIHLAWKIAYSLSEIHEVGCVVLNNISAENIIVSKSSDNDYAIYMIGLGSASLLQEENAEHQQQKDEIEVQKDLRSLGGVFFELFTGKSPNHQKSHRDRRNSDKDERGRDGFHYRPLRELRSILSLSQVPSQVAEFILELMGAFGQTSDDADPSNVVTFDHYCYKRASEVSEQLYKMISEEQLKGTPSISPNEESHKSQGWLNFAPNSLYGRKDQQVALLSAYERVFLRGGACEVVLVSGLSGTGKTTFVEQSLRQLILSRGGHFLHVKFDQLCQAPLAAIFAAFTEFCDTVLFANDGYTSDLIVAVEQMAGEEGLSMLAELIPNFGRLLNDRVIVDANTSIRNLMSHNRLNFVFQAFFRAITCPSKPMVLFLDDLQWADKASLDLVRSLIMGSENSALLIVESYRTNEVTTSNHPFTDHLSDLNGVVALTGIELNNLKLDDLNCLLSDAISEPQTITEPLSNIIYRKTGGNTLLAIQFVESLWNEGLLWFSYCTKTWKWNTNSIQSKSVLEDAADLIAQKIMFFPPDIQMVLKKMACLGSQCEKATLYLIGSGLRDDGMSGADETSVFFSSLDVAVHEGIIDDVGSKYKFAHDQIQLATYSLIPQCERSSWHLSIGKQMIKAYKEEELEKMLFVVVDQLNRGSASIEKDSQRIDLAELNYRAGEKAKSSGLFSSSALFFEEGMKLIEKRHWNDHYDLWLRLYTSYADSEFRNGNFEKMTDALDSVITNARCFDDQLPAYRTLIFSLGAQKKLQEAIEMGLGVLEEAGEQSLPDPDASIIQAELQKTKTMLEGKTVDSLLDKVMNNERMITIMEILESMSLYAIYGKPNLFPIMSCKILQLSLSHGVCASTISGFANYSLVLCGKLGAVKEGNKYGRIALSMMEKMEAWNKRCRLGPPLYGFVFPRTEHLHSCLEPTLNTHYQCVKIGDTEFAVVNSSLYCTLSFQGGKRLSTILKSFHEMEKKAIEYKQESTLQVALPMKQTIMNLMGQADNPMLLEGDVISFKQYFAAGEQNQNIQVSCRLYLYQMRLAYMFGEFQLAAQIAEKCREIENILLGKFECCELILYCGLTSFSEARKSNEGSWKELAEESVEKMKKWAEDAPCNCEHKLCLLEAEGLFLAGSFKRAIEKYESAILLSGKNGFIQDEALSYERAAICHLENDDESTASYYYGKAHDAYLKWGAKGKADHLCRNSPF